MHVEGVEELDLMGLGHCEFLVLQVLLKQEPMLMALPYQLGQEETQQYEVQEVVGQEVN